MSGSLRKACHACAKSKRKCIPKLPACERCASKGSQCIYDLEPVAHHEPRSLSSKPHISEHDRDTQQKTVQFVYPSVESARQASVAAVAEGHSIDSAATRPLLMSDAKLTEFLIHTFTDIARDGLNAIKSPFVHPTVFRRELSFYQSALMLPEQHPSYATTEKLVHIHDLITLSLQRLLIDRAPVKNDEQVEKLITRLFSATRELWGMAPIEVSETLCPFENWVVGESIRRSMFAAIHIRGFWWVATQGYVHYEPFFESLPFDPRADVWAAETEDGWLEAVHKSRGGHTELVSYHEFITKSQGVLQKEQDGLFQRILFICYFGSPAIAQLPGRDR